MQPLQRLDAWLRERQSTVTPPLFRGMDLRNLFSELDDNSFRGLLHRACRSGRIERVARGLYLDPYQADSSGRLLFLAGALLRPEHFNYISLETALSEAGWISQMPMNWVTLVSTGRTNTIACGSLGTVEYVHTSKNLERIADQLIYDPDCHLYRATPELALADMRAMKRPTQDLVIPQADG